MPTTTKGADTLIKRLAVLGFSSEVPGMLQSEDARGVALDEFYAEAAVSKGTSRRVVESDHRE